jgi:signal transduction histidine kinase
MVARGDESVRATVGSLPETRELSNAFNTMLDALRQNRLELEEANREIIRKSTLAEVGKFSMMVAHEVKNPLSIIKTSFDMLKKNAGLSSDDTMVYYIEDEIRRLNKLIEDFLGFARPGNPVFREVDLNAILKDLVERFELGAIKGPIRIRNKIPAEPCPAEADPDLLRRAIGNILKNAVEASARGGEVIVSALCENGRWTAIIEDEGEGIREEDMSKLFEPFFTTRSKGTGLGLAYALQVLRAHSGRIIADNRPSAGAVFRVEVPLRHGGQNAGTYA